jgi:hypothetical protein
MKPPNEALKLKLAEFRREMEPDGIIKYAMTFQCEAMQMFLEYMESIYGQENSQSHPQDEEGSKGHRKGQAKTSRKGVKGRGKEERKAKA